MSIIVPIRLERCQEDAALLRYSVRSTDGAVYLHCTGALGATLSDERGRVQQPDVAAAVLSSLWWPPGR